MPTNTTAGSSALVTLAAIGEATAKLLGPGFKSHTNRWQTTATLSSPYVTDFHLVVADDGDLTLEYDSYEEDDFPQYPELPKGAADCQEGIYFPDASPSDSVEALAELCAAAIRAATGR